MSAQIFDTIVVGSGTSAYFAVQGLLQNNPEHKIAMIDERPFGGTCALRGCQPKKYLVSNAEAIAMVRNLTQKGLEGETRTNWESLQQLKNEFLDGRSEAEIKSWRKKGVTTFLGSARMISKNEIAVNDHILKSDIIVLATGSVPKPVTIDGSEFIRDSEYFLDMPSLPDRVIFIGGGYISFEFAHVAARAGAKEVIILVRSSQALKHVDQEVIKVAIEASEAAGIRILFDTKPIKVTKRHKDYFLYTSSGDIYETDLIIGATGRIPNLSVLAGGKGQVEISTRGVIVNQYLQSVSNTSVYAIGDCAATPYMLAPVADKEGQTIVDNILYGNSKTIDYRAVPSAIFTTPGIGSVGMTEAEAKKSDIDFRVKFGRTNRWPSSKRIGEEHGAYKVLIDNSTDLILGAHLVRHNAEEVINFFGLAMKFKIKASELADYMWAYPTYSSDTKYMVG